MKEYILEEFRLPRYHEIPNVGLYLEQVTKYIDDYLKPIGDATNIDTDSKDYTPILTSSMISNYVKKKIIDNPVKKQYYREQIAYLIFIAIAKSVLSLEDIRLMIHLQKMTYASEKAYNYFVEQLETTLKSVFEGEATLKDSGTDNTKEKTMLKNTIIAVSYKIYLDVFFAKARTEEK